MTTMLNQAAVEAICAGKYLENYLDCLENLPDDLQRIVTQLRELDSQTSDILRDIGKHQEVYQKEQDEALRKRSLVQVQRCLIKSQELGDEKLQLVALIIDYIENRTRQLAEELENLDPTTNQSKEESSSKIVETIKAVAQAKVSSKTAEEKPEKTAVKRQRRQRTHAEMQVKEDEKRVIQEDREKPKKKKKRKMKKDKEGEKSPADFPIDPDEPTYCLCDQVSYGEMIGCDNDDCEIEWFHFNCVGLSNKPKGKWFCPNCRGDKPTVMKKMDK